MTSEVVSNSSMPLTSPTKLDFQGLKRMDSKLFGLGPVSGMAKKHPDGKDADLARRLRILLEAEQIPTQVELAKKLGVEKGRLNNPFSGYSLSVDLAMRLRNAIPGMTRDWLYDGDESGLSVSLRERLRAAETKLRGRARGS
jgi:hypothetical protein